MVADSAAEGPDTSLLPSSSSSSSSSSSPLPRQLALGPRRTPRPPPAPPTHFPTFSCKEDCELIRATASQLQRSSFYWGPLGVEEAHRMLRLAPPGSYLIRDSRQKDVFFTLSYHGKSGPVSVRIDYKRQSFSLAGTERSFPTLFALLEHYARSPRRSLSAPCRRWAPTLQELCRRRIVALCGGGSRVPELPLTHMAQDFLLEFPFDL